MDPSRFSSEEYGRVVKKPGDRWAFWYFDPVPLPREYPLSSETVLALSRADAALGRLNGVGRLITQPGILVQTYLTREALASSRIEGTTASLSEVLQAKAAEEPSDDEGIREVLNYQKALDHGIRLLDKLPLGIRVVREVHEVLLTGVRGQERRPGEFRTSPVWIGSATDSPDTAAFVPPLPEHIGDALADWENFLNDKPRLPALVRCGLMHYQFETIHPFLDGNGRVGRLLIMLMLLQEELLTLPLLYISAYMEADRRTYYERLQAVREEGRMQEWLQYFLTGVERQAVEAEDRAEKLVSLREHYRKELLRTRSRAVEVVELLFSNPFLTVRRVERSLNITNQGARNLIQALEERRWIERIGTGGRSGRVYWVASRIFDIIK